MKLKSEFCFSLLQHRSVTWNILYVQCVCIFINSSLILYKCPFELPSLSIDPLPSYNQNYFVNIAIIWNGLYFTLTYRTEPSVSSVLSQRSRIKGPGVSLLVLAIIFPTHLFLIVVVAVRRRLSSWLREQNCVVDRKDFTGGSIVWSVFYTYVRKSDYYMIAINRNFHMIIIS